MHHCSALLSDLDRLKPPPQIDLGGGSSLLHGRGCRIHVIPVWNTTEGLTSLLLPAAQVPGQRGHGESCSCLRACLSPPHSTSQPRTPGLEDLCREGLVN